MNEAHSHGDHHLADKPSYDDIKTPVVIFVGIVSAILTYLIVVVVQGLTYQMQMDLVRKRSYDVEHLKSVRAIDDQKRLLLADESKERLSIEQAMDQTLAHFSQFNQATGEH